jgi:hypothetical protein
VTCRPLIVQGLKGMLVNAFQSLDLVRENDKIYKSIVNGDFWHLLCLFYKQISQLNL